MKRYAVIDYARGGRALRVFDTREAAQAYMDTIKRADDPQRAISPRLTRQCRVPSHGGIKRRKRR